LKRLRPNVCDYLLFGVLNYSFLSDIVQDIDAQINLFADDTSLYLVADDPIETAETLNGDLDKIHIWSEK
jgi:hypothetical protein